jgi:hypothetical protein
MSILEKVSNHLTKKNVSVVASVMERENGLRLDFHDNKNSRHFVTAMADSGLRVVTKGKTSFVYER